VFAAGGEVDVMTIQAQLPDRSHVQPQPSDRPTVGLKARHPFVVDSFALLDHRTRARSILEQVAPPGRYLSVEQDEQTRLIPLDRPITHIGRGLTADVRLEDAHVSRRHAIVAVRGDGDGDSIRLLDDRSSNGTFVNGRPVTVAQLTDGDVLRFGRVVFRYVEIAPRRKPQPLRRIPLARRSRAAGLTAAYRSGGAPQLSVATTAEANRSLAPPPRHPREPATRAAGAPRHPHGARGPKPAAPSRARLAPAWFCPYTAPVSR
jgi:hypothetical protein